MYSLQCHGHIGHIIGFRNQISNASIKGKTAHWSARPLANEIVDIIDSQNLSPEHVMIMKESPRYYVKDKVSERKLPQECSRRFRLKPAKLHVLLTLRKSPLV